MASNNGAYATFVEDTFAKAQAAYAIAKTGGHANIIQFYETDVAVAHHIGDGYGRWIALVPELHNLEGSVHRAGPGHRQAPGEDASGHPFAMEGDRVCCVGGFANARPVRGETPVFNAGELRVYR